MLMRTLVPFLPLLAGCPAGTSFPSDGPPNPAAGCEQAGTEYVQATSGTFTPNQFIVDGQGVLIDFNAITTCVRSDGGGAAWLFSVNGSDYGVFRVEGTTVGTLPLTGQDFLLDLYGAAIPFSLDGADMQGFASINGLNPYTVTANGTASDGDRVVILDFFGSATP